MQYEDELVLDFAQRTMRNLEFIEQNLDEPEFEVFEVTQLINSLLGLLVFPQQKFFDKTPEIPLKDLVDLGWPKITFTEHREPRKNLNFYLLRGFLAYLRNGISHFNVEFLSNKQKQITGLRVWNIREGEMDWEASLSLVELKQIIKKFIELMEKTM